MMQKYFYGANSESGGGNVSSWTCTGGIVNPGPGRMR